MKKVLVIALAALLIMASCSTAFAATTATTTTYGSNGITVTTIVTGADAATMVSFLAYNGAEKTLSNLVYADQQTSNGAPLTFSYTDEAADVKTSEILLGASAGVVEPANEELGNYVKVITVGSTTAYAGSDDATISVAYPLAADKAFVAAKVGGVAIEGAVWADGTLTIPAAAVADGAAVVVETEDVILASASNIIAGRFVGTNGKDTCLSVFAKVVVPEGEEYGIIVNGTRYEAKGKNDTDGAFAVLLLDENGVDFTEDLDVNVYVGDYVSENVTAIAR